MANIKHSDFKQKILAEMSVDHTGALEKNFELAKRFVRITKDGKVDVIVKDRLPGQEQILLYLIGKLYAKEAGLTTSEGTQNKEMTNELGINENSLLQFIMRLRSSKKIRTFRANKRTNSVIQINQLEKILNDIKKKTENG